MASISRPLIIAIDGPAASGKGTLARKIADHYGLNHLDTGLTYRAVAKALIDQGLPLDDEIIAAKAARALDLGALDRNVLADHTIGEAASKVAVMGQVRLALVEAQRGFAAQMPGAVLDGRDIGTVVCPDAKVKLYVTASSMVRAARRHAEMATKGQFVAVDEILADIEKRDARDMGRTDSPLKPAEDSHLLDTTDLSIEAAFEAACRLIDPFLG